MKKINFAAPLFAMLLFACDPTTEEVSPSANVTSEELTSELQLNAKSTGNNNIKVITSPVHYIKVYDASNDILLGEGTDATIQVTPPNESLNVYVTVMNHDGSITKSGAKSIAVSEYTDLPNIYYKLFGDDLGTTKWGWDTEASNGCWGNGGYEESTGPDWWKVGGAGAGFNAELDEQASSKGFADDGEKGWFTLSLSGVTTSRGETGFVKATEDVVKSGWDIGTLTFSGTTPLLGILPNQNNQRQYVYQILKADGEHLYLSAPEPGAGDWGNGWFWNFKKK